MEAYMPFVWIGLALLALLVEAGTSQMISIWFSLGALGGAICCIFTDNIVIQVFVFIIVTTLSLVLTRPIVKKFKLKNSEVKTNIDRVIGCEAMLTKPITKESPGEIKVLGDYWMAVSSDGSEIKSGTKVRVLEIKSTKLVVEEVYSLAK
ncbi:MULTISPECIES: NfeD family protein [unclassified Ruminococcus]|uniref:NfeD family protein n=1 Tax=unclassified Ruminococcus TaxID=2608920 RepID=UPI0021099F4A|nr:MULTISPECIES: NfeD family protein [unclassified Ruminococcus]